jgi:5-methyltetrahydropteroyltriglutamate--homocysteine methyltransferase
MLLPTSLVGSYAQPDWLIDKVKLAGRFPPERLVIAPDCGLKYLPRDVAFGKMNAMADGAAIVRAELG